MTAIWKYPLSLTARRQDVLMPQGAEIVHVAAQDELPTMWAKVDERAPRESRAFAVFATGEGLSPLFNRYHGTVHIGWTVWHIFEDCLPTQEARQ